VPKNDRKTRESVREREREGEREKYKNREGSGTNTFSKIHTYMNMGVRVCNKTI
jgi:hypothetical protein